MDYPEYIEYEERTEYTLSGMPITYLVPTQREPLPGGARPHQTLRGKTPAEVAGIKFPYRDWTEIVRGGKKLW